MRNNCFMLGQNESWKNLHKEKVESFREKLKYIPHPPENPRCYDLYSHLHKYLEDPHDKDQVEKMQNSLKKLNRIEDIPKTKGRLCGGLLCKGDKAYKCHDCMTQDNSVLCPKCFELDKHVGHDFERFQVFGGCCDCGDIQKWKEEGFCTEHSKDEKIEIILDEKIVEMFLQEQLYALKLLLNWYSEFQNLKKTIKEESWSEIPPIGDIEQKMKNEAVKLARIIVDTFGGCWVEQLVEFNKAGKFANTMTEIFFRQEIRVSLPSKQGEQVSKSVLLHLFSMTSLKITPQKVSDLCITMFPMLGFRQTVTEVYVNFYNNDPSFPPSDYTHLSSQLLTSYMAISKLIKEGKMNALRFEPVCQSYGQIQSIAQGYLRYYYDIRYLSKLYGDASTDYFKLHGEQKKFVSLGYYRIILDQFDKSIDYYGLDEIFLERMMPLIKVIERDPTQSISNMALRELYRFIATAKTSNHNKFRPQERLFTWILFVRINGDISLLQNDGFVRQIFGILGVQNFHEEIGHIISNLSSVFETASKVIQNINEIESKYTFYSFYLKKSQNLFNLDSLLLKIALKFCEFYKRSNPFFEYAPYLIANETNPAALIVKNLIEIDDPGDVIKIVRHLINYVAIVLEAIFSDLPILALSAIHDRETERIKKCSPLKMDYEVLALHYYQCLMRGEERDKIQVKDFKKNVENFFKEEKVFKIFVQQYKDPTDPFKIIKKETSGPQINSMYFKSLCSIPSEKYNSMYYLPPYMKWKKNQIVNVFLHPLSVSTQVIKRIYSDFQETEGDFKNKFIPYIIIELWKINLFSQSAQSSQILEKLLSKKWIEAQVHSLDKKILSQIYSKEHLGGNDSEAKRKEQNRKKFQEKKALMNLKMNKNAEMILQKESILKSESSEMKNQSDFTCCLCMQTTEETLYLLGFVTFTSGNGWLNISQSHSCIPIFDSCGHAVHRSCYLKIMTNNNANRVYLYCPLCKQPTNILLPEQETLSQECVELFLTNLMKIYQTQQYKAEVTELKNAMCRSLIFQMIIKGCTMYQEFLKNIKTYRILYKIYTSFLEKDKGKIEEENNSIKFKILALDTTAPQLFWDINNLLASILNKDKEYSKQLSQIFIEHAFSLLCLLEGNSPMLNEADPPEQKAIQNSIVFPKLQSNLAAMNSKYRGKCLQCGLVTNNQMICLNCPNFVTCTNCSQVKLIDHSNQFHAGLTVYVKTSSGEPLYLMRNRCWKFQSLYEDYMGRIYDSSTKLREDFQLNESRLFEIKKDILTMKIERKVRYQENQTKKIYNQEIF